MSIEIPMRREGAHLVPVDAVAAEMLAEVPTNTGVMVTVKVPRNLRQFRLAWALADIVSKSVDFLADRESAMDWLKIKARHVRMIHDPLRNVTAIVPKSISFASLDQAGFARVLNRMIYVTTTEIIPGLEESSLRAELESIVGIEPSPELPAAKPRASRAKKSDDKATTPQAAPSDLPEGGGESARPDSISPNTDAPAGRSAPANEAEYITAARSWIAKQTASHEDARAYFDGDYHVELRRKCGVSIGVRNMLRRELAAKYEGKENGKEVSDSTAA